MVKNVALGVCVYKSYERSKLLVATCTFQFTGLTYDEQTTKVPLTNQRPICKIGNTRKTTMTKTTKNKQTLSIVRLGALRPE